MLFVMAGPKGKMINVRLTPEIHAAFKIACDLRGVSMSSFLHQTIVRTIREEKEREPKAFVLKAEPARFAVEGGKVALRKGRSVPDKVAVTLHETEEVVFPHKPSEPQNDKTTRRDKSKRRGHGNG